MRVTIVGATGSMSGPKGAASCYLVQADGVDPETGATRTWSVVMDLGPGSFGELWRYVNPGAVDALLITHGHADHMADIISYHVFLKWHPDGPHPGLKMAGPREITSRAAQIDGYTDVAGITESFDFQVVQEGTVICIGPLTVTAFPGNHLVETYGFRIEGPSESGETETVTVAYTGDTDSCGGMDEMARGVDLLLAECGFTDQVQTRGIHLSGSRAGAMARDGQVGELVLTHIQPWTDPQVNVSEAETTFDGKVSVARPGMVWRI